MIARRLLLPMLVVGVIFLLWWTYPAGDVHLHSSRVDLGRLVAGQTGEATLQVVNGTGSDVRIERIESSCGCAIVRPTGKQDGSPSSAVILPGESRGWRVTIETSGRSGILNSAVTFHGISSFGGRFRLTAIVSAWVTHGWRAEPSAVDFSHDDRSDTDQSMTGKQIMIYDDVAGTGLTLREINVSDPSIITCDIIPLALPDFKGASLSTEFQPRFVLLVTAKPDKNRNHWVRLSAAQPGVTPLNIPVLVPTNRCDVWAQPSSLAVFGTLPQKRSVAIRSNTSNGLNQLSVRVESLPHGVSAELLPGFDADSRTLLIDITKDCAPFQLQVSNEMGATVSIPVQVYQ